MTSILASSWTDGVHVVAPNARYHELAGRAVRGLAADGRGGALAIVDGHSVFRRSRRGEWAPIAKDELNLACCLDVGGVVHVGTEHGAHVLRCDANGEVRRLDGFDRTPGAAGWYAGTAVVGGRTVGPPLGLRALTATADRAALLACVHVGGLPRSVDGGATWEPTLDLEADVHDVAAHPTRAELVVAASAVGLWVSRDAGATWACATEGLRAVYCSAVAFTDRDILVAASSDHFAAEGWLYRCPIDGEPELRPVANGLPRSMAGIVDTGCLTASGAEVVLIDTAGALRASRDGGRSWSLHAEGLVGTSGVLVVD